jgi:hypothetical protein
MALNLHAARRLTIRAWEALKAAKGSVVFISGSAALNPKPGFAAVAAEAQKKDLHHSVCMTSIIFDAAHTKRRRS